VGERSVGGMSERERDECGFCGGESVLSWRTSRIRFQSFGFVDFGGMSVGEMSGIFGVGCGSFHGVSCPWRT
jgi:hypothetical protein